MRRAVSIEVRASVTGGGVYFGNGRSLTEALVGLGGALPIADHHEPELLAETAAIHEAIGGRPWVTAEITSRARWWNPWSWGSVSIRLVHTMKAPTSAHGAISILGAYKPFLPESGA